MTRYEYDVSGRLVRSVQVQEPEWSPADVAVLLYSRHTEQDMGPHGVPMSEATNPANQYAYEAAEFPVVDFAEKARLDAQKAYYDKYDTKDYPVNRNGHIWRVGKKTTE